jgi:hypothetical protein
MCCAVEYPQLSQKMGVTDPPSVCYSLSNKNAKVKLGINMAKERKLKRKEKIGNGNY